MKLKRYHPAFNPALNHLYVKAYDYAAHARELKLRHLSQEDLESVIYEGCLVIDELLDYIKTHYDKENHNEKGCQEEDC